ncbi:MAG: outer membrane beta-barrel protein [Vicinamibacterales bacterium]
MRLIPGLALSLLLMHPVSAPAQFLVQGSIGPTIVDSGHNLSYGFDPGLSLAAGLGFSPTPRLTLAVEVERTIRADQLRTDARGDVFGFRGGTLTLATAELRASLFGPDRVGPYGLVGVSAGVSQLRVTDRFPERVTHGVRALTFGGGLQVPLGARTHVFVDGRMIIGTEASELLAVTPIRVGLGWRF